MDCYQQLAFVGVVLGAYSQNHIINSLACLRCGRELLPTMAATGVDIGSLHVDVGEGEVAILSGHKKKEPRHSHVLGSIS